MAPLGIRKQPSGAEKRRKRKEVQEFLKSQENAMLKYVVIKKPEKPILAETVHTRRNNIEGKVDIGQSKVDSVNEVVFQSEQKKEHVPVDMFDPGNWGNNVDAKMRDLLVKNRPATRLPTDYQFPKNAIGRHFSHALYIRELSNGEKVDRCWLVYSKTSDKAFCFCCKLFRHEIKSGGHLVTTGYNNWRNVSTRLKEHERTYDHILCMTRWKTLEIGLEKNQTIDKLIK